MAVTLLRLLFLVWFLFFPKYTQATCIKHIFSNLSSIGVVSRFDTYEFVVAHLYKDVWILEHIYKKTMKAFASYVGQSIYKLFNYMKQRSTWTNTPS